MSHWEDLTWKTFHWLTVIKLSDKKKWRWLLRECRCKCWKTVLRTTSHLNEKVLHSCWCRWWEYHHLTWTHFYRKYQEAKKRCENPKVDSYKYYGGRWIKFMRRNFNQFYDDMYESYLKHCKEYWEKDTLIDRIDSDKNYCKDNCRWATKKEQSWNRRNIKLIEYKWKMITQRELAKELWVWEWSISYKIRRWIPIERIINNPHKRYKKYL